MAIRNDKLASAHFPTSPLDFLGFAVTLSSVENKKLSIETLSYDEDLSSLSEETQNAAHALLKSHLDFRDDFPSEK